MDNKTIESVVKTGSLCTGCGTCVAACPCYALEMVLEEHKGIYTPRLDQGKCNECGLCLTVCPGNAVNFPELNSYIFNKQPIDIQLGNYLNCYTGYAAEDEIRFDSASGGMVTSILNYALEEGLIDGAIVTKMNKDNPLEPQPFIARTREEIIESSKSKYCPVPVNIILKEVLESKDGSRFAIVGLPCHIHGIRKYELANKKIRERIVLRLGLFCSRTKNLLAQDYLLKYLQVKKGDIRKFIYREGGYFGDLAIILKSGSKISYPYFQFYNQRLQSYFTPWRCTLCSDQCSELADISLGDIWIPEFFDDKVGTSSIITRTATGQKIINEMVTKNKITISDVTREKVVKSQSHSLNTKKKHLKARFRIMQCLHTAVPDYNQELCGSKFSAYLQSLLVYLQISVSSQRFLWWLLEPLGNLILFLSRIKQKLEGIRAWPTD
ncbi:MAG: Coenzyme F420 hydrogenase/dehydrogenase, beta subunit C-terminal domain [Dehalococcoidales bacterium]|nr:Coenzyme F420 hydrogenase/dehydrogenase, beta subunit C-terminal domain [Dehalococcoidales bacterium]